jgi:ParB family chromosome partitioning protein
MSLKTLAAEGHIKKTDKYRVPLKRLRVKEGFNKRLPTPENAAHVEAIYQTLHTQLNTPGMLDDAQQLKKGERLLVHDIEIKVDQDDGDSMWIVDGHCSVDALWLLVNRDKLITEDFLVDIAYFKGTWAQARMKMLVCGSAKELDPLEFGLGLKESRDLDGYTLDQLVAESGRSIVSVRELLKLADADPAIHQLIIDGKVKSSYALAIIKQRGDGALAFLQEGLKEAAARGKDKLTAGVVNGRALPKKIIGGLVTAAETLSKSLPVTVRRELAELEKLPVEQLSGRTVQVDAKTMLDFLAAQDRIDAENRKRDEKAAAEQQVAHQAELLEAEEA